MGTKKFLHSDRVQHLSVPQYEGLGIKEFLVEAGKNPDTVLYFPDEDDIRKLPRQWVINVTYTLVGRPFADWVQAKMEARNQELVAKRDMAIMMDPDILLAFNASSHISSKQNASRILPLILIIFCRSYERQRCSLTQGR